MQHEQAALIAAAAFHGGKQASVHDVLQTAEAFEAYLYSVRDDLSTKD